MHQTILKLLLVKPNQYIIVLLSISLYTSSTAQKNIEHSITSPQTEINKNERMRIPTDSIRSAKLVKVNNSIKKEDLKETQLILIENQKVKKTTPIIIKESKKTTPLEELSNTYWQTQSEIKIAKTENNLMLLQSLEQNSKEVRLGYISVFESSDPSIFNAEQIKLYESFKKDFINE